jgi:hypothetical protein
VALAHQFSAPAVTSLALELAKSGMFTDRGDSIEVTKAKILTRIMFGQLLGLAPMAALTAVNVIKGKPTLSAGAVAAAVMRSGVVAYVVLEHTDKACRIEWTRKGKRQGETVWSIEDAKRAGLSGDNWRKYPRAMLFARAITEGARTYCPDVFGGPIYTADELRAEVVEVTQAPSVPVASPAPLRDAARANARQSLIAVVEGCGVPSKRVFDAIMVKMDKPSADMTAEDFAEMAGRLRAIEDVEAWCALTLGEEPPAVDAEVIDDGDTWDRANKALHAEWHGYCAAVNIDPKGEALTIMHDKVRHWDTLPTGAPWDLTTVESLVMMRNHLKHHDLTTTALATEWRTEATERGAL